MFRFSEMPWTIFPDPILIKMNPKKEIKISGGGPSGLSAAINLARSGYDVALYEQRKKPGAKFNNGWQILENYSSRIDVLDELKQMNIDPDFYFLPQNSVDFFDNRLNSFRFKSKKPFGYYIKRGTNEDTLDSYLFNLALDSGVRIHLNTKIDPQETDIIATGSRYAAGISKEIVFKSDSKDILSTILDNELTPYGFSYLFILNGHGTIGTAILKDHKNIHKYAENVLLRFRQLYDFDIKEPLESVSSVGFFVPRTAVSVDNKFVGESAGFQDYLFGLGIRRAIQSGYLAAKSIIEGTDYDILWKNYFEKNLLSSILNRFFYEKAGKTGYSALLRAASKRDFQKIGYFLQNPSFFRLFISKIIMKFSGSKTICRHPDRCDWCRIIK
ncbi:NAD(P)/FAD-dependent oxidoreductase [candidate division KSB1 bacterium]